ncbi:MAG: hypothetical protein GEU93_08845 [Propionibacteriales bacterium]|nr:hypothetical protein [Propionibacteriales bacterium]
MIIEQSFTVRASRDDTAAFLLDINRVSACVPGFEEVEEVEPGRYRAVLGVRLGPIHAAFQGTMALDDSEAPQRLTATGDGRDRATGSVAKVSFAADLTEEQAGETTVTAVVDVALRGRLAQFGTGVMRAAAGEMVEQFATCANASLAAVPGTATPHEAAGAEMPTLGAAPTSTPATPGIARILLRSIWKALRAAVRNLLSRRGPRESTTTERRP